MTDSNASDFLSQYKVISNKLKKRFLRKPNVAEPSDQFAALGSQCERDEQPQYAALCHLAVARCEAALHNPTGQAWALRRASRQLLHAHTAVETQGLVSPGNELLEGALSAAGQAAQLWGSGPERLLAAGLALETGTALDPAGTARQATAAAALTADSPTLAIHALSQLASSRIQIGDLDGALSALSQMVAVVETIADPPFGIYSDILLSCEISRVLVLLLLRPPPQMLSPQLTAVLERYSWLSDNSESPVWGMSEEVALVLQSLVMACQARDAESLVTAETALWPHLDSDQRQLLRCLVHTITSAADN